jgi:hypothetical protein
MRARVLALLALLGLPLAAHAQQGTVIGSGGISQLTGDVTAGPGSGLVAATVVSIGGHLFSIGGTGGVTFTLTGPTTVTLPTSGTLASLSNNLGDFAATTSAQLAGVISDETGSGALVFGTSPTISAGTLSGITTLPGSGQISAAGNLGIGMVPANSVDATATQNAPSRLSIINASAGTAANAAIRANNGTNSLTMTLFGTGFTPAGVNRADGALISSNAATGGLTLSTGAVQPIYFAINSSLAFEIDSLRHQITAGATPTCGTGCSSIAGNDNAFVVTTGAAQTSIAVNFGSTWAAAPVCNVSSNSTASVTDVSAVSGTAVTFGASVALTGALLYVNCRQ